LKPSTRTSKTIVLPFASEELYNPMLSDKCRFRQQLEKFFFLYPELFPVGFEKGFRFCGTITSKKTGFVQRRVRLHFNTETYQIRPSFIMPYTLARTKEVEKALYLRLWGVSFVGLTYCFGRYDMFWYRTFVSLGRNSIVGTTVKTEQALPKDISIDEKHWKYMQMKAYIATTVS